MDFGTWRREAASHQLSSVVMLKKSEAPVFRPKLLDIVSLRHDAVEPRSSPWGGNVAAGAVGTVVEELRNGMYLVEFDVDGKDSAILTLPAHALALDWSAPDQ